MGSPPTDDARVDAPAWSVRVAASDGGAEVFARGSRWRVAVPVAFDTEAPGLSALECALGALGGDLVAGFMRAAERDRLPIDHAEAVVHGTLEHPLAHLGVVGEAGEPALGPLRVDVFVASPASEAEIRATWEGALSRSPLANTFRRSPGLVVRLTVTP